MEKDDIKLLTEIDQRSKSNTKRLDEHEKKINSLTKVYVALTQVNDKIDNIDNDVKDIKKDVDELKDKPMERYEYIVRYILTALIGGAIGIIFAYLGLK